MEWTKYVKNLLTTRWTKKWYRTETKLKWKRQGRRRNWDLPQCNDPIWRACFRSCVPVGICGFQALLLFAADHSPANPALRCSPIVSATTRQFTRLTHLGRLSVIGNVGKTQCYLARKAYSLFHRLQTGLKIIKEKMIYQGGWQPSQTPRSSFFFKVVRSSM